MRLEGLEAALSPGAFPGGAAFRRLLHTFGTGANWEQWMNLAVGCLVCLLTAAMGVYMIRRANREIKTLQEKSHGESFL